jgi:Ca-activated chloride channel family protein
MPQLAHPWMLLLLMPLLALAWHALFRQRRPTLVVAAAAPFQAAAAGRLRAAVWLPLLIETGGVALLILALARPQQGVAELRQRAEGIDIVLALDLSGSMRAIDLPPEMTSGEEVRAGIREGRLRPRIEVAKDEIRAFIEKRPNDRIGLVVFATQAYAACPPTLDHPWLLEHLRQLEPGSVGESTNLAAPVASGVNRLRESTAKRRVLVFFSDGENTVADRLTPRQAVKLAKASDVVVYTVGIGSRRSVIAQPNPFTGRPRLVMLEDEFDEPLLKEMAETTDGRYYAATDAAGLRQAMDEINRLEKTTFEQPRYLDHRELAAPVILAGLALLLLAFGLRRTFFLVVP